jgi:hypothetical protein
MYRTASRVSNGACPEHARKPVDSETTSGKATRPLYPGGLTAQLEKLT